MQETKVITIEQLFEKIIPNISFNEEQIIKFMQRCVEEEDERKALGRQDLDFSMNMPHGIKVIVPLSQVKKYLRENVLIKEQKQSELDKFLIGEDSKKKVKVAEPQRKKEEIVARETALPREPIREK